MKTDYKFWYIKRDDDGFITEAAIRFYEGDITTEKEKISRDNEIDVTRYRRFKRLQRLDLPHFTSDKFKKEFSGADAVLYTNNDFGNIKTNEQLEVFLNGELKKDVSRTPIKEQS